MGNNQIIIEACNNGWMVIIPFQVNTYQPGGDFYEGIVAAAKAVHGNDDVLERIKNQQAATTKQDKLITKAENVFIFQTFQEVLDFLEYKLID